MKLGLHNFVVLSNYKGNQDVVPRLHQWIKGLTYEFELHEKNNGETEPWRLYAERPLMGMLTSSIIRADKLRQISVLQEFAVCQDVKFLGRCDLLVSFDQTAILVEFKRTISKARKGHLKRDVYDQEINKIFEQCQM